MLGLTWSIAALNTQCTTAYSQTASKPDVVDTLTISPKVLAKKPTLVILPSDNWCSQRYFMMSFDNQGSSVKVPDYSKAFLEDTELPLVISKVGQLLTAQGYSLKDAEMELKNINIKTAEDNVTYSKSSGAQFVESPLDILKRRVKADIIVQINWNIYKDNGGKSCSFTLEAIDSYTNKRIATSSGTGTASNAIVPSIIEEAVKTHIPAFDIQMDKWYMLQKSQGREIVLTVRIWDNWDRDLETEYDGEELIDCIQEWMRSNTVGESFSLTDATENMAQFEQVRIPLIDSKGKAQDARAFATSLRKHLAKAPYNIASKVMVRGLGEAIIVLGEK